MNNNQERGSERETLVSKRKQETEILLFGRSKRVNERNNNKKLLQVLGILMRYIYMSASFSTNSFFFLHGEFVFYVCVVRARS